MACIVAKFVKKRTYTLTLCGLITGRSARAMLTDEELALATARVSASSSGSGRLAAVFGLGSTYLEVIR